MSDTIEIQSLIRRRLLIDRFELRIQRWVEDMTPLRHEDLMVIFPEDGRLTALYLDNEGHSIHYLVSSQENGVVFLSQNGTGQPQQRPK